MNRAAAPGRLARRALLLVGAGVFFTLVGWAAILLLGGRVHARQKVAVAVTGIGAAIGILVAFGMPCCATSVMSGLRGRKLKEIVATSPLSGTPPTESGETLTSSKRAYQSILAILGEENPVESGRCRQPKRARLGNFGQFAAIRLGAYVTLCLVLC